MLSPLCEEKFSNYVKMNLHMISSQHKEQLQFICLYIQKNKKTKTKKETNIFSC